MSDTFNLSQADDGTTRIARVSVPGCGRNEKDDAPIILVKRDIEGNATLIVYGDILSTEPTHEIPLGGAKLTLKGKFPVPETKPMIE